MPVPVEVDSMDNNIYLKIPFQFKQQLLAFAVELCYVHIFYTRSLHVRATSSSGEVLMKAAADGEAYW